MAKAIEQYSIFLNKWKNADSWPLPGTDWQRFYFHSRGHANNLTGDGNLSRDEPGTEPPDIYVYNPLDPVPNRGGRINPDMNIAAGPLDQSLVEKRNDVLCYVTPELTEELEVTGPVKLHLFAATSAEGTGHCRMRGSRSPHFGSSCAVSTSRRMSSCRTVQDGPYELSIFLSVGSYTETGFLLLNGLHSTGG